MLSLLLYGGMVLAALLSLWRPQVGIYCLVPLLPLQTIRYRINSYPMGGSMVDVVLLGVILGMLLHRDGPLFKQLPMKWLLILFAGYMYLSLWNGAITLGGPWPVSTANVRVSLLKNLLEMPLIYAVVFAVMKSRKQIKLVVVLMCIAALLVGVLFYRDMHAHDLESFHEQVREAGVMGYAGANGLAAFSTGFALFLVGLYGFRTPGILKVLIPCVLVALCYAVLYTFSRGAYLAMMAGLLFVGLRQKRALLVVMLVGLMGATVIMPGAVIQRISGTFVQAQGSTDQELEGSAEKRLLILQDATGIVAHNPVLGIGFETYQFLHPVANLKDTHDFFLKIAVEEGFIGVAIFFAIFWRMLKSGYDLFRKSVDPFLSSLGFGFTVCMVGVLITNVFGDRWSYPQVDSYWWILMALVCRALLLPPESAPGGEPEPPPVLEIASA
jgi:hypothetical protein